jgi:hypothetical protein
LGSPDAHFSLAHRSERKIGSTFPHEALGGKAGSLKKTALCQ